MKGEKPGLFDKAWWSGQVLEWAMRDPAFKTEMFRFVDVFPVLTTPDEIYRHVQEYLLRPGVNPPRAISMALKGAGMGGIARRMAAAQIARNLEGTAKNFIAGADIKDTVKTLRQLRKQRQAFTVDVLGEATVSEPEAEAYAGRYRVLIDGLTAECAEWKDDALLDTDDRGGLPRVNISVKASAMYSQLDPIDPEGSVEAAARRLLPLFVRAREQGAFINIDMESHDLRDLTYALFRRVMETPEMAGFEDAGVVVQAYLRDAEDDLRGLIDWAERAGRRITIRLVKGAYWDYETVKAHQEGWPSPVWLDKGDSDACFERCADILLGHHAVVRTAIGSHNVRSIAHAIACAEHHGVPQDGYEIQCLYGMAEPIKAAVVARGHRLRVYAPVGELIPGMAYLVRRLLENTSNESWLRHGFAEGADPDTLLARPHPTDRDPMLRPVPGALTDVEDPPPFQNEPLRDFAHPPARAAFGRAVAGVTERLGGTFAPVIDGRRVETGASLDSIDPADGATVIGHVQMARIEDADAAVAAAKRAFPGWRDTPARDRAATLFRLAAKMRAERDALSALVVREVGKPWREADGEVCEAIDFCEYYAREMLRLDVPQRMQHLPGELDHLFYEPRGVALVIAPWNFPAAILTGMTAAALVTGNTVVMKPAEQSMVIAARIFELAQAAGVPPGVLHFLPGQGETVGAHLVAHPDVATIAFTGSMAVGLEIWRAAGVTLPGQDRLKRVVCEMGGKNAIIVDSDADLDEAVSGVVKSAFGYAGQKCSACSRVIVLDDHHDAFVQRLEEATASLVLGDPADPATAVGPLVERSAQRRLETTIAAARSRARLRVGGGAHDGPGFFVQPTIFDEVSPEDPLANEEFFGPLLAVLRARDFEHALELANGTRYALTGGVYSRSPAHIEAARRGFRVGNLYINRGITGAIVGRQPFGGSRMSGAGTKAGGPDYLLQFLDPRAVSENTLRRGFAPEE
jgi:RHH-type proline utilization regulon transcriptional repressor/proline dehydrogenase/delta 1-pyrroline-5-carboxylate dehydrogenase